MSLIYIIMIALIQCRTCGRSLFFFFFKKEVTSRRHLKTVFTQRTNEEKSNSFTNLECSIYTYIWEEETQLHTYD